MSVSNVSGPQQTNYQTTSSVGATSAAASSSAAAPSVPLADTVRSDFIDKFLNQYDMDIATLKDSIQQTNGVINNLTVLSDMLNQIGVNNPPVTHYPFQSNSDITNLGPDFTNSLVDILNKAGYVDKNGNKVKEGTKGAIGYGDYFKQQLDAGNPDAYKLVLNVGEMKTGLDSEIQDLWKAQVEKLSFTFPSDADLVTMGNQILDIRQNLKDYLNQVDPDQTKRNDSTTPEYQLNQVILSLDKTFKPYDDFVAGWGKSPESIEDYGGQAAYDRAAQFLLISCTKTFLIDGQDNPTSPSSGALGKTLKNAQSSYAGLSETNTRTLQAKTAEYQNFVSQGAAMLKMISDMILNVARNISKTS